MYLGLNLAHKIWTLLLLLHKQPCKVQLKTTTAATEAATAKSCGKIVSCFYFVLEFVFFCLSIVLGHVLCYNYLYNANSLSPLPFNHISWATNHVTVFAFNTKFVRLTLMGFAALGAVLDFQSECWSNIHFWFTDLWNCISTDDDAP